MTPTGRICFLHDIHAHTSVGSLGGVRPARTKKKAALLKKKEVSANYVVDPLSKLSNFIWQPSRYLLPSQASLGRRLLLKAVTPD